MRGKSARVVNRYAKIDGRSAAVLKRVWKAMSHTERFKWRQKMNSEMENNK